MTQKHKIQLFIACSFVMASFQACGPVGQPFGVPNNGQSAGTGGSGSGSGTTGGTPTPGVSTPATSGSTSNSSTSPSTGSGSTGSTGSTGNTNPGAPVSSSQNYMADPTVTGHTLEVCDSGCNFTTIAAAAAALADGDTVNVHVNANGYTNCVWMNNNNIIFHGVLDSNGNRPILRDNICGQKGLIVQTGVNFLIENFELSGARNGNSSDGSNYAGIRLDTNSNGSSRNLKVRNCVIHDSDDGILGNDNPVVNGVDNQVVVENSIFFNNGRQGYAHGLYIGHGVTNFVFRNSVSYNNLQDGHLLKTRAVNNTIECSTLASLNGANSYALDIPVGGSSIVRNSVIEQGPNINNGGDFFIRYGEEIAAYGDNGGSRSLSVQNTYFINDNNNDTPNLDILSGTATPSWSGNTFAGHGGSLTINNGSGASSFTNYASRSAAGLPSFNGSLSSLPAAPVCN